MLPNLLREKTLFGDPVSWNSNSCGYFRDNFACDLEPLQRFGAGFQPQIQAQLLMEWERDGQLGLGIENDATAFLGRPLTTVAQRVCPDNQKQLNAIEGRTARVKFGVQGPHLLLNQDFPSSMAPPPSISDLVSRLNLQPHPEGGFFTETYRDTSCGLPLEALPSGYKASHSAVSTAIYFLVPGGNLSKLHRIPQAEVWHFYLGDPLTVLEILPNGEVKRTVLGQDIAAGQSMQYVVPPHNWFGSYSTLDWEEDGETKKTEVRNPETSYSLVGCTVAPGFEFSDFEMATRDGLLKEFPHASKTIAMMTDS